MPSDVEDTAKTSPVPASPVTPRLVCKPWPSTPMFGPEASNSTDSALSSPSSLTGTDASNSHSRYFTNSPAPVSAKTPAATCDITTRPAAVPFSSASPKAADPPANETEKVKRKLLRFCSAGKDGKEEKVAEKEDGKIEAGVRAGIRDVGRKKGSRRRGSRHRGSGLRKKEVNKFMEELGKELFGG